MVQRFDSHPLRGTRRTDAGAVIAPGAVGRTGVLVYHDRAGREIREYRDAAELFAPDSLATLTAAPITVRHPASGRVDAESVRALGHGFVLTATGREKIDAEEFAIADLVVTAADTIKRIDSGELAELSCGYRCDTIDEPGITPAGERYDRRQVNIRYNHVALLPPGGARAGSNARLRIDSNGDQTEEHKPMPIKIGNETFDVATADGCAACQSRIDAREADLAAVTAARDVAVAENAKNRARLDAADAADAARARVALVTSAKTILGAEYNDTGRTDDQVRADAIKAALPEMVIPADANSTYFAAAFDAALAAKPAKPAEQYRGDANPAPTGRAAIMAEHCARLDALHNAKESK